MKICKFILTFCISLIIALIIWYYFVYKSFYLGYSISEDNQSYITDTASSKILKSSVDDNIKKNMLNELFKNAHAKITVKNISANTVFYTKEIENSSKFIGQTLFVMQTQTDKTDYEVKYVSYCEPKLIYAIKSAICMNRNLVQEKVIKSDDSFLNLFAKIKKYYCNHILSIKFWLLVIVIMLLIYRKKIKGCFCRN
jgi:hypothetical protein